MSSSLFRDIELKRQRNAQEFEPKKEKWLAKLVRFNGNLRVPNREGYVYAQQLPVDDAPPPVPVLCTAVQARENLRVWISKNNEGEWAVETWWQGITQQGDYNLQSYLPLHGADHEWPDLKPKPDAVNVYPRSLTMLRAYPSAGGGLNVGVSPLRYIVDGEMIIFAGDHTVDLSAHQPAAGFACWVGVYLDLDTNAVGSVAGATAVDAPAIFPPSPTFPDNVITSAMVRLDGDATVFYESDFIDLRMIVSNADTGRGEYNELQEQLLWVEHIHDVELTLHMVG